MIGPVDNDFQPAGGGGADAPPAWDLVRLWAGTGARQMAVDHALAESVWAGRRPPTLRLYGWKAPALTIGRLQRPEAFPRGAVRRFTGGRAVYHQHEVTLCLALPAGHPLMAPTVPATYRRVMAPLLAALRGLGLPVRRRPDAPPRRPPGRLSCFATPTAEEAEVAGHKVVALAQRVAPGGLMAQASMPLGPPTAFDAPDAAAVVGLSRFLPGVAWEEAAEAVVAGFSGTLGVAFRPAPLTRAEARRAAALETGLYAAGSGP